MENIIDLTISSPSTPTAPHTMERNQATNSADNTQRRCRNPAVNVRRPRPIQPALMVRNNVQRSGSVKAFCAYYFRGSLTIDNWTLKEYESFLMGIIKYGRAGWAKIAQEFVTTKSCRKVARFADAFFKRVAAKCLLKSQSARQAPATNHEPAGPSSYNPQLVPNSSVASSSAAAAAGTRSLTSAPMEDDKTLPLPACSNLPAETGGEECLNRLDLDLNLPVTGDMDCS